MKPPYLLKTNGTFNVATLYPCSTAVDHDAFFQNSLWRQTLLGCQIIYLMQEVHGFNINYVYQQQDLNRDVTTEIEMYSRNATVDIFARPMSLRPDVLTLAHPVTAVFDWNFGFTIAYPDMSYRDFYSKPFTMRLWSFLCSMAIFCSIYFYLLKKWEKKVHKETCECSYGYELLMVIGAYCQHIPPIEARIMSRRTAYFVFFMFAYIVYTYYTSNLLSHLVNDKNNVFSLSELLESDIECVVLDSVQAILNNNLINSQIAAIYRGDQISTTIQKLLQLRAVSMEEGVKALKTTKTALLSDYISIAPFIRKVFNSNEICTLAQIDVVMNLKKYFFVAKTFPYKELSKLSLLRIKESGLLHRIIDLYNSGSVTECTPPRHVETQILQIAYPLALLVGAYVLSLMILIFEVWHYNRNKVWPYVN